MAIDIGAKAIVVSSISGRTVRMVSRFRVPTDIVGMATSRAVWYKLALSWGVQPVLCEHFESTSSATSGATYCVTSATTSAATSGTTSSCSHFMFKYFLMTSACSNAR